MKVGVIGAGTMGQGIAKAFAQVEGYTVALCDIKQEWAEGGKDKIANKIEKADSRLDGKIVLNDVRYENGRFSAAGVSSASVAGALLQKLSQAMSPKLGTGSASSGAASQ